MTLTIPVRKDSLVHRLLTGPTLAQTWDMERAESSRWNWRLEDDAEFPGTKYARLTPLGVLSPLLNLQLVVT